MSAARPDTNGHMRLHLLRHAHAGDAFNWSGDEALRPLTQKGREQSERLGRFLEQHGVRPDVIVSSPKIRALQTAEIVAGTLGMMVRRDDRLAERFGQSELWSLLDELGAREPMLVGHDPDLSMLLEYLVDAEGIAMRKATLATIDMGTKLSDGDGSLRWLIPADLLQVG